MTTSNENKMNNKVPFRVDPRRIDYPGTGIYVRARHPDTGWESVDISWLDRDSLRRWLTSRGGDNPWAENTVLILLGHEISEERKHEDRD